MQTLPTVLIHAFEPSPSIFAGLVEAFVERKTITLNNCGVGSQKSELDLNENTFSEMTSFLKLGSQGWGQMFQPIKVPVTTIDGYSAERGIKHIHLLKIDTQGFDLRLSKAQTGCWRKDRLTLS